MSANCEANQMEQRKAQRTAYKKILFSSRLEVRWAKVFDELKVAWDYEPRRYELPNGSSYLPDFWLPEVRTFVEVKSPQGFESGKACCRELCKLLRVPVALLTCIPISYFWSEWEDDEDFVRHGLLFDPKGGESSAYQSQMIGYYGTYMPYLAFLPSDRQLNDLYGRRSISPEATAIARAFTKAREGRFYA